MTGKKFMSAIDFESYATERDRKGKEQLTMNEYRKVIIAEEQTGIVLEQRKKIETITQHKTSVYISKLTTTFTATHAPYSSALNRHSTI